MESWGSWYGSCELLVEIPQLLALIPDAINPFAGNSAT